LREIIIIVSWNLVTKVEFGGLFYFWSILCVDLKVQKHGPVTDFCEQCDELLSFFKTGDYVIGRATITSQERPNTVEFVCICSVFVFT
jgi:hypothetical protein